jgi:hypothetical protein
MQARWMTLPIMLIFKAQRQSEIELTSNGLSGAPSLPRMPSSRCSLSKSAAGLCDPPQKMPLLAASRGSRPLLLGALVGVSLTKRTEPARQPASIRASGQSGNPFTDEGLVLKQRGRCSKNHRAHLSGTGLGNLP